MSIENFRVQKVTFAGVWGSASASGKMFLSVRRYRAVLKLQKEISICKLLGIGSIVQTVQLREQTDLQGPKFYLGGCLGQCRSKDTPGRKLQNSRPLGFVIGTG